MNNVTIANGPPAGIPRQAIQKQFQYGVANAYAAGDPRFTVKQYDRPGLSRGGAQWNQAGIDSAENMANGIADAYSQQMQANNYNANLALQGQQSQEQFAQALGGLQQQNNYAAQLAALQQQAMFTGALQGLL